MVCRIVARQGAVQVHADPLMPGDEHRFGARIQGGPDAGLAVRVARRFYLQRSHGETLEPVGGKSIRICRQSGTGRPGSSTAT